MKNPKKYCSSKFVFFLIGALVLLAIKVNGQDFKIELLPENLEIDLALSAVPKSVAENASIFVLKQEGFVKVRKSSNSYSCFCPRTHWSKDVQSREVIIPMCYDREGMETIAPVFFDAAKWRLKGMDSKSIGRLIEEGFISEKYKAPGRTGLSYMISPFAKVPDGRGGVFPLFPHFMVYAPNVTNEELNTVVYEQPGGWHPWVNAEGPHGMLIIPVSASEKEKVISDNKELGERFNKFFNNK